jgi:putative transport protein
MALGSVKGFLLGGISLGDFFVAPVSDQAKSVLLLLFLFGIGYSVGPVFSASAETVGDGLCLECLCQ